MSKSNFADEADERMNGKSKTVTKKQKNSKPVHERAVKWIDTNILPYIAKVALVAGFSYAVVDNLSRFNQLPGNVQGAIGAVVIGFTVSRAAKRKK